MSSTSATLTIRNVDPSVRDRLRVRAALHGRSMEAELRVIVAEAVAERTPQHDDSGAAFVADVRRRFAAIGYADDLVAAIPPRDREPGRPLPTFEE